MLAQAARVAAQIEVDRKAAAERAAAEEKAAAGPRAAADANRKLEEALRAKIAGAADVPALFPDVCNALQRLFGATGVYIGRRDALKNGTPPAAEGGDAPVGLRYAAACSDHAFMREKQLVEGTGAGVTLEVFKTPEVPPVDDAAAEEMNEEQRAAAAAAAAAALRLTTKHWPNMLMLSAEFFGVPRPGALVAVPLRYNSPLNEKALGAEAVAASLVPPPAAEGKEGGGEEKKEEPSAHAAHAAAAHPWAPSVPSAPPTVQVDYVLCLDTLGQNRPFSAKELSALEGWGGALVSALERSERAVYEAEFKELQAAVPTLPAAAAAYAAAGAEFQKGVCGRACLCVCARAPHADAMRAQSLRRTRRRATRRCPAPRRKRTRSSRRRSRGTRRPTRSSRGCMARLWSWGSGARRRPTARCGRRAPRRCSRASRRRRCSTPSRTTRCAGTGSACGRCARRGSGSSCSSAGSGSAGAAAVRARRSLSLSLTPSPRSRARSNWRLRCWTSSRRSAAGTSSRRTACTWTPRSRRS